MALSAAQKAKLQEIEVVLKQVQELIVPPSAETQGRVSLTIAGDFAGGWTLRPGVKEAVVKIAEVINEG